MVDTLTDQMVRKIKKGIYVSIYFVNSHMDLSFQNIIKKQKHVLENNLNYEQKTVKSSLCHSQSRNHMHCNRINVFK
jgi:hypothetical protein